MPLRPEAVAGPFVRLALAVAPVLLLAGCCRVSNIRTESLPDGTVGQPYSFTLEHNCSGKSSSDVVTWTLTGALPPGLRFSGNGRFSGTPTAAGSYSVTISLVSSTSYLPDTIRETRTFSLAVRPTTGSASPE